MLADFSSLLKVHTCASPVYDTTTVHLRASPAAREYKENVRAKKIGLKS
jgi:hypothetical protein